MKSNGKLNGTGFLKEEYYGVWADYFLKFLDAYAAEGLDFWALTTQNEPIHGIIGGGWNCMGWWPDMQREFIKNDLGPRLRENYPNVSLIILDDQRFQVLHWLRVVSPQTTQIQKIKRKYPLS
jgi:glucosylceramidase